MAVLKLSNVKRTKLKVIEVNVSKKTSNTNANTNTSSSSNNFTLDLKRPFISIKNITNKIASSHTNTSACVCITDIPTKYKQAFITYLSKATYKFDKYVSQARRQEDNVIYIHDDKDTIKNYATFFASIKSADLARDLENEPANLLSPDRFCKVVKAIFKTIQTNGNKTNITVMNETEMKKQGLNLVLSIGLSSKRMPRFMTIEHFKDASLPTICLVGKTVIFDAGGLNIKLSAMEPSMKTDKSGGAVVVAIMKHLIEANIKCNLVGILPVVENLLSEDVTRPGDIVKSHSGKTVEITDTDAEGRLIMADAISYSKKYNPTYLIDLATLTGWSETVHLDTKAVCYTKNMELASLVNQIGDQVGERVWFLPPWDEYTYYIKSKVANVRNYNPDTREGAYLPSMFLLSFVPISLQDHYIHFDICNNFTNNLAQGNCVVLVSELIRQLCQA
jgi:leucyl aminopeptidase